MATEAHKQTWSITAKIPHPRKKESVFQRDAFNSLWWWGAVPPGHTGSTPVVTDKTDVIQENTNKNSNEYPLHTCQMAK